MTGLARWRSRPQMPDTCLAELALFYYCNTGAYSTNFIQLNCDHDSETALRPMLALPRVMSTTRVSMRATWAAQAHFLPAESSALISSSLSYEGGRPERVRFHSSRFLTIIFASRQVVGWHKRSCLPTLKCLPRPYARQLPLVPFSGS